MAYGKNSKNNMFVSKCTVNKQKCAFLSTQKAVVFLHSTFKDAFFFFLSEQAIPTE